MPKRRAMALVVLLAMARTGCAADRPQNGKGDPNAIAYGAPRLLCRLANRRVNESSGMTCSRRNKGVFWTHNDSGDGPRIYAFNAKGEDLGTFVVPGVRPQDCEDMASFTMDGKHYLLIGDAGDNAKRRESYALYIVEEPALPANRVRATGRAKLVHGIFFTFEDGPQDGEGVAIDTTSRTIFVATRTYRLQCDVYALPFPTKDRTDNAVARRIARLKIRVGNAMDISPDGRRAIVGTYGDAHEFTRRPKETWAEAFARRPRVLKMPRRRKGEAIAYGTDGATLYLTSEGSPCPLWEVPVKRNPE